MKKTMAVLLALAMLFATSSLALASEEYPEHIHMEVANWEANTSGTPKPWEKLENEKFNMDVTWRAEDWGNYQDVIALWGASDELPDVFCGYIDETWFGDFISQQLIRDIPMETLKQYPNLYAVWEMDVACQALYNYYGKVYYFPRNDGIDHMYEGSYTSGQGFLYRKDWAEKLGFDEPTNMDELLEILIAFAQQDPDGNGKNDTYGLTRSFAGLEGLWSWFNCFPDYWVTSSDGSVIPGYLDRERMLDGLNWLRKAYQGGGVDPEWQGDVDGFVNETFGAYTYNNDPFWQNNIVNTKFGTAHPELGNPLEIIGNFTALPAHEGVAATTRPYFMDGMCVFSYKCSDAVMERVLAVMDWALTEEGAVQTFYGVEGIDYTWKEDGTINQINGWTNCTIGSMTSWNPFPFDTRFLAFPNLPEGVSNEDMLNWNLRSIKMGNEASHNPAITFNLTASLVVTEERANFVFDHTGGLLKIVTGTDEVETMYDAFVQDAYDSGLQAVIDAQNKAMMK